MPHSVRPICRKTISDVVVVKPADEKQYRLRVLTLLSQSNEMRKEVKKAYDPKLNDTLCRGREKPYKGGFHAQWHTELKVRGSVEAIRRLADTKLLHSYW